MTDVRTLETRLKAEYLWRHDPPNGDGPWYVRLLLGGAAWLGACLLLPLIGLMWLDTLRQVPAALLGAGLAACVAGIFLQRRASDFFRQAGSAVTLAGLLTVAIELESHGAGGWLATAGLAVVLYLTGRGYVHRLLTAGVMVVALIFCLTEILEDALGLAAVSAVLALTAVLLWWCAQPLGWLRWGQRWSPMALAFTIAVSVLLWWVPGVGLLTGGDSAVAPVGAAWIGPGVLAGMPLVITAVLASLVGRRLRQPAHWWPPVGMLLLAPVWLAAPGVGLAVCWLALGHAHGRPVLAGVGLVALLTYLARFYYLMEIPLLHKAFWLGVAGASLLVLTGLLSYRRGRAS